MCRLRPLALCVLTGFLKTADKLAVVLLLLVYSALPPVSPAGPDNRGKLFIVGFGENSDLTFPVELFVTTTRTTTVNVLVTAPNYTATAISEQFTVTSGVVKQLVLDGNLRMVGSARAYNAIQIVADDEVIAYGVNADDLSCDAYLALPVDVLGLEYYTVSWFPSSWYCQLVVIGVEDATSVSVQLSSHLGTYTVVYEGITYGQGQTITTTLQKYQMLQLQTYGDLSGTYIKSTKPVGVLGGNQRTDIGIGTTSDHLVEQLAPVTTWGKNFVTVPIPLRTTGDYFRFVASEDSTDVVISGDYSSSFTIALKGTFIERTIPSGAYTKIVANKPISVFQFCMSQQEPTEESDPLMMYIPPIEQYGADYTFSTPKYSDGSYINYFMFVVKSSEKDGLRWNGAKFPEGTVYNAVAGTDYVAGYILIPEGFHVIRHTSPISTFGGYLYGKASLETYGFPTGMRMAPINTICIKTTTVEGDGLDNDCDGKIDEELCTPENKGADEDGDGISDEDCAAPAPIDGQWGTWSSFGACSVSCNTYGAAVVAGTYTRTRSCDNPAPMFDGLHCVGNDSETTSCTSSTYCPINGGLSAWTAWSSCSVTCAYGTQTRSRTCTDPTPQYGGASCSGSTSETQTCTFTTCPIDGHYTLWTAWGTCSLTCGGGTQERTRSCTNPAPQYGGALCVGAALESQSCNTQICPRKCRVLKK